MLDQETIQSILGIKEKVCIKPEEMADKMNITFFHYQDNASPEILYFGEKLKKTFEKLKVNIVPYEESLTRIPLRKTLKNVIKILINDCLYGMRKVFHFPQKSHYFDINAIAYLFKRTKVKKGISIIVLGEQESEHLPMQYIYNFKDNSVITILDFPKNISKTSSFHEHFDTAISLFAQHMTNIVIGVDEEKWLLYNFNASHPIFPLEEKFEENVLHALVPKIVAPIRPYLLSEFIISKDHFNFDESGYKNAVNDLVQGALLFDKTALYPVGKKIDDLPFRNDFYRWIGKLHLDNRNGMSYGFMAVQLPNQISPLISVPEFETIFGSKPESKHVLHEGKLFIFIEWQDEAFWLQVPDVWVLSQKSGSDKTHVNPKKDLIKLGLSDGRMIIETQYGEVIDNDYKTSFDTQVILAHAVGNAIIASILAYNNPQSEFLKRYLERGVSLSHWHGYIHPEYVQKGWFVHGITNPHVACSSPQSAIYALQGKLDCFKESLKSKIDFRGDIQIEPHHGTNICYTSITDLAKYLINNPTASQLGNNYYYLYNGSK